jgi:hypothetical protein
MLRKAHPLGARFLNDRERKIMSTDSNLPIKGNLSYIYSISLFIAVLTALVSIAGFLYRDLFYPTDELVQTFVPNDVVALFIGLPILLGSMWASRRGKLLGLLFWTGALFFGFYNSIAYVFAIPFSWGFLLHLILVVSGVYTLIALVASIDGEVIQQQLRGAVHEKMSGGIVAGVGILFLLRVVIVLGNALIAGEIMPKTELAPNISDLFVGPAFVVVGIALWKRKNIGYVAGLGLLFQASMLFIGLIVFLLLQPILTSAPFAIIDVIVVFVMGLVCFVPSVLFIRGVMRSHASSTE